MVIKSTKIENFFKRKVSEASPSADSSPSPTVHISNNQDTDPPPKLPRLEMKEVEIDTLERDPGLRRQIYDYPLEKQDEIRHAYINFGPYQPSLEFPLSGKQTHPRRFKDSWYTLFPWLEYSPAKDAAFCHPCFIFNKKTTDRYRSDVFTVSGFRNWKKVNSGIDCAFLGHIGKSPNSTHNAANRACQDLMKSSQHIANIFEKQTDEQIEQNRLRLAATINAIRYLTFQSCALRGNDESIDSLNPGNFIELIKVFAYYNDKVAEVVLEKAPGNAKYISSQIQKEVLHVMATKVRKAIREEIGDAKFCIIVDEARDESKREQMGLVLRFVDKQGFVRERFFNIVHVKDTKAATLKKEISTVLSNNNFDIQNLRGQGYDGASNMRGEWRGLQALFLNECPYAYFVHCFAHRLQLALVTATKVVLPVYHFFSKLSVVINTVGASSKRHDELQAIQSSNICELIANGQLESGTGQNQIGTLQRAGDTRWSSHLNSVCSLMKMYNASRSVLLDIVEDTSNTLSQRGDADAAYTSLMSYEFVFILHIIREVMGITDGLCQALQNQSQDILNALQLVKTTKTLIQDLRDNGWVNFLEKVNLFCNSHGIDIPDMGDMYVAIRSVRKKNKITNEHFYRFDLYYATIDTQLQELSNRFNEHTMELFILSTALEPKDAYKSFNADDICTLVDKFYPEDFTEQEKIHLRYQLQHYGLDVPKDPEFQKLSTISELCQELAKTEKSKIYTLIDRVIRLVLTLPVSTATTERAFSAMKLVKSRLRNKMEDDFLADSMMIYIEKEIAKQFSTESIIDDFDAIKTRRVPLRRK